MVNLHVFKVRLKQRKVSSHPPSSISPSNISPSPIPPSPNPPSRLLSQFDYLNIKNHSVHLRYDCWQFIRGFQKSGTKSRGVFTFCTATAILPCTFCPAVLPSARENAGQCEKTTWRHKVDNIRQKDIKVLLYQSNGSGNYKVPGSIPASSDTVESEGWQMKQCWTEYKKIQKNPPN